MSLSADDMADPLRSTHLTKAELLMRETIQNSADERLGDPPVRFTVSRLNLLGSEKRAVVQNLRLTELNDRAHYFPNKHGWLAEATPCLANLTNPDLPLPVVTLSDYGTNGLGGRWDRGLTVANRFHNLVLSISGSMKLEQDRGLIGSYGVGKMVYALTSDLRTIAYYSVFPTDSGSADTYSRFMATGFFPKHQTPNGTEFTGHAFFGKPTHSDDYPAEPLINDEAASFVESLGFATRSSHETGLTVFLFGCTLTIDELRGACERYWWPRLIDDQSPDFVRLEFVDHDKPAITAKPSLNAQLRPFIDCYRNLIDGHEPPSYDVSRVPKRGKTGGLLYLRPTKEPAATDDEHLTNAVALIRRGFVIAYDPTFAKEEATHVVGVFNADNANAKAFAYSEPPAHDSWNPNNDRLRTSMGEEYVTLVRSTLTGIKTAFRDFQVRLEHRPKTPIADDVSFLENILGPIFRRRPRKPTPPTPRLRAITIHKEAQSKRVGRQAFQTLHVSIGLTDAADVAEKDCEVTVDLQPLVDAAGVPRGTIPRTVYLSDRDILASPDDTSFTLRLSRDCRVELVAEAYAHPSWRLQWLVSARPATPEP